MRAMVVPGYGGPDVFELRNVPEPVCGPGRVRVGVEFCGVNFTDVRNRRGDGLGRPPMIVGIEVAGRVLEPVAYLGRYVNVPLRRLLPPGPAAVATFVVSGAIHDAAITAVTRSFTFLFVPWFLFLGLIVIATTWAKVSYSSRTWVTRAAVNLGFVCAGLVLALVSRPSSA